MDLNHSHHEKPLLFLIVISICLVAVIFYLSSSYSQQSQAGWPDNFGPLSLGGVEYRNNEYQPSMTIGNQSYINGMTNVRGPVPTYTPSVDPMAGLVSTTNVGMPMPTDWARAFANWTINTSNPINMANLVSGRGSSSSGGGEGGYSFGDCEAYNKPNGEVACRNKINRDIACGPPMGRGQCYERFSSCEAIPTSKCPLYDYPSVNNSVYRDPSGKKCAIYNGKCSEPRTNLDLACGANTKKSDCVGSCFWQGSLFSGQCLSNNGEAVRSCLGLDSNSCSNQGKEYCEAKNAYCGTNGNEDVCASFFVEGWTNRDYCYIDSEGANNSKKDNNGFNISCDKNPATSIQNCNSSLTEASCNSDSSKENGCAWKDEFKCVPKKASNTTK